MSKSSADGEIPPQGVAPPGDEEQRLAIIELLKSALARLDASHGPKDAAAYVQMAIEAIESSEPR